MFDYQYLIIAVLFVLCIGLHSRVAAFVVLSAYIIYNAFIVDLDAIYYYLCASLLNLNVGLILQRVNKPSAICSYILVIANLIGFFMWGMYLEPDFYNFISAIILIIQVATIMDKGLLNGFRFNSKYIMAKLTFFNGYTSRVTMYKRHEAKGK